MSARGGGVEQTCQAERHLGREGRVEVGRVGVGRAEVGLVVWCGGAGRVSTALFSTALFGSGVLHQGCRPRVVREALTERPTCNGAGSAASASGEIEWTRAARAGEKVADVECEGVAEEVMAEGEAEREEGAERELERIGRGEASEGRCEVLEPGRPRAVRPA